MKINRLLLIIVGILMVLTGCGKSESSQAGSVNAAKNELPKEKFALTNEDKSHAIAADFDGGDGSVNNPYQISTAEQLALLSDIFSPENDFEKQDKYAGSYFIQTKDFVGNSTILFQIS